MKKAMVLTLLALVFTIFTAGCIDELVAVNDSPDIPDISAYEFDVFVNESANGSAVVNTTTFYLSDNATVKVVYMLINTSMVDIVQVDDLSSNMDPLTNIVIIADYANETTASSGLFTNYSLASSISNINYTLTKKVIRGQKHTYLTFNGSITGFVAYTMSMPKGQDFVYIPTSPSVARFVLPAGYTTGNPLIGTARPVPDKVYYDNEGRENLIWYTADTGKTIMLKYYSKSAPGVLLIGGVILAIGALLVLANYHLNIQHLKKIREQIEEDVGKKKTKK